MEVYPTPCHCLFKEKFFHERKSILRILRNNVAVYCSDWRKSRCRRTAPTPKVSIDSQYGIAHSSRKHEDEVLRVLLKMGLEPNAQNRNAWPPLHIVGRKHALSKQGEVFTQVLRGCQYIRGWALDKPSPGHGL